MLTTYLGILVLILPTCMGMLCYSCQSSGDLDPTCEKDPAAVPNTPIINCNKKYCTIFRQEFKDPKGRVNSFNRGCEEKPIYVNNVITDFNWVSYYRSCTTDLCNSGTGVSTGGSGGSGGGGSGGGGGGWLDPDPGGSSGGGTLFVPGESRAAAIGVNLGLTVAVGLAVVLQLL